MSEPAVAAASVGPGSILGGKYRLDRVLGSGAMGTVYAALHEKLGREVAIKVLNGELGKHDEAMQRFQREAELVTKLGHPNIVAVYDFGLSSSGAPYFVMEVVSGQTLRQRLERGPLSDDEIIAIFAPLLSAASAAHAAGVVHRDLKPAPVPSRNWNRTTWGKRSEKRVDDPACASESQFFFVWSLLSVGN